MGLREFVDDPEESDLSLAVVNRQAPRPVQQLLEQMFVGQEVTVQEQDRDDEEQNVVYLLDAGDVVAKSPLSAVQESLLVVNSDLYKTGTRKPEDVELPAVIDGLENTPFRLRGHPESDKEKLLLITVSRYIERMALENDGGTHRASFQRLSRINDEQGTRAVYERLADTNTDTHVYGIPDWTPPPEFDVTMHGGWNEDFRTSWFVVHVPPDSSRPHAALVAIEVEPGTWDGLWTYDTDTVQQVNRYIEREL